MPSLFSEVRYYLGTFLDRLLYGGRARRVPESLVSSMQQTYLNDIRSALEAHRQAGEKLAVAIGDYERLIYKNVKVDEVSLEELRAIIDDARKALEY